MSAEKELDTWEQFGYNAYWDGFAMTLTELADMTRLAGKEDHIFQIQLGWMTAKKEAKQHEINN